MSLLPWEQTRPRVAIIGDIILDEYLNGTVNRISPEAPVPVHLVQTTSCTAGGAANVARNVQLSGGEALLLGICGDDQGAKQLKEILSRDRISTDYLLTLKDRPTIKKTRVTANSHQLVRIDWERTEPIDESVQTTLLGKLELLSYDIVLLSDYGKGCLTPRFIQKVIEQAKQRGKKVVIDPKGRDYSRYKGATVITPNRKEACEALALDSSCSISHEQLARNLKTEFSVENVLVTLGAQGMYCLFRQGGEEKTCYLPAVAREVFDVSGAGDTVVALMALCLAVDVDFPSAMHIANTGAGSVVEKWGTQPIRLSELKLALKENIDSRGSFQSTGSKVTDRSELSHQLQPFRTEGKKIGFTNGCFDILHAGHLTYLESVRSKVDVLVVGVNLDSSVKKLKGAGRPIVPFKERAQMLAGLSCVDLVVGFGEDTPLNLILETRPDFLAKGADYNLENTVGAKEVLGWGGSVELIPLVPGLSTSAIIKAIKKTDN